jgi:hypothetical protein
MELNLRTLGATGNGIDDDSPAWRSAMSQLGAGGSLLVPPGVYQMPPFGAAPFCLDGTVDNVTLILEPGAVFKMPAGMPARSVSLLRLNRRRNWKVTGGGAFDGNWGNAVGGVDDHTGINHATQGDPKSHLAMVRGCEHVVFEDIEFRDSYGDHVWVGHGADPSPIPSLGVYLNRCSGDMSARNGFTIGGPCSRIRVTDSHFRNIYAQACDFEPNNAVDDLHFRGSSFGLWWSPHDAANSSVTIDGQLDAHATHVRFDDCTVDGCFLVQRASDVKVRGCRIRTMWGGKSWAPVMIRFNCDRITFEENEVWDSNVTTQAVATQNNQNAHAAAMMVGFYADGPTNYQPRNVSLVRNRIWSERGIHGIRVCGTGGGLVDLDSNVIDLSDRGLGKGGRAIDLYAERPGIRVRAHRNRSRNANGEHLRARFTNAANAMLELDVAGERAIDDQINPTCAAIVRVDSPRYVASLAVTDIVSESSAMAPAVGL